MVDKTLNLISGEMVFLESTTTRLEVLDQLMTKHQLSGEWLAARPAQALQHVMRETYLEQGKTLVRKTSGKDTFEVVEIEEYRDHKNSYKFIACFCVDSDGGVKFLKRNKATHVNEYIDHDNMTKRVKEVMKCCLGLRVSTCLFKVLQANFGCVRVSRGAYFIPAVHLEKWNLFANDWTQLTPNRLSRIQSGCDHNTAMAVVRGAKEDLQKRYDDIQSQIAANDKREVTKSQIKRKLHLANELKAVEQAALDMGSAFNTAITLVDEIKADAKLEQALALL
tara:strand:- start:1621 stop:2460 length:840 start_codon:yes stop_codon:yes gene_type:complete